MLFITAPTWEQPRVHHREEESGSRFHGGMILTPRGHVALSRDIFDCPRTGRQGTGIQWVETRAAAKHPTSHRAAPS